MRALILVVFAAVLAVAGVVVAAPDAPDTLAARVWAPAYYDATTSERLAVGALLERQEALRRDSEAVTAEARHRLGLTPRTALQFDPARGLWVAPEGVAPVRS